MIPKTFAKGIWLLVLPKFVLGAIAVVLFAMGLIPLSYLWLTLVMWILISGLGIAVGYHRIFSHRTHTLKTWQENIILFFATFAAQGSPIFWVAVHRGYHHPYSDTARDLHSPVAYSKWHAFVGWLNQNTEANNQVNIKYAVDLLRKPNFVWFHKNYYRLAWAVPLTLAVFDWQLAFAMFFLPSAIALLQDNGTNVFGHTKAGIGYRNFDTTDNSQNNFVLGYLGWGQGWHNNHHARPARFDFGSGTSGKWWEWDPCRIFLPLLGPAKNDSSN